MVDANALVIGRMRARVEQCRRLAAALTDTKAAVALQNMADEVEADIARLEASSGSDDIENPMPLPPSGA